MAKYNYFLLCENFILNEGKATIINVFDAAQSELLPSVVTKFTIAFGVNIDSDDLADGKIKVRVDITDPKGDRIVSAKADQVVDKLPANIVSGLDFSGKLVFKVPGDHKATLYINDAELTDYVFNVKITKGKE